MNPTHDTMAKKVVLYYYLQALSAKGWSPKGRRDKEKHTTCKTTGGIRTWDLSVCSLMFLPLGHSVTSGFVIIKLFNYITPEGG